MGQLEHRGDGGWPHLVHGVSRSGGNHCGFTCGPGILSGGLEMAGTHCPNGTLASSMASGTPGWL